MNSNLTMRAFNLCKFLLRTLMITHLWDFERKEQAILITWMAWILLTIMKETKRIDNNDLNDALNSKLNSIKYKWSILSHDYASWRKIVNEHPPSFVEGQPKQPIYKHLDKKLYQKQNFWDYSDYVHIWNRSEKWTINTDVFNQTILEYYYLG